MKLQGKLVKDSSVTAIIDNKPYQMASNHPNYELALKALSNNDAKTFVDLLDESKGVEVYVTTAPNSKLKVTDEGIFYDGKKLHNALVTRILDFKKKKFPVDDLLLFLENLMSNPSSSSINELYDFLSNKNLPITPNGTFLAYKKVQNDYYSITKGDTKLVKGTVKGGRVFNGVGEEIECERNEVDDDRRNECSFGLHVGALDYVRNFGSGRIVIVEVNPKDVVAVPLDYNAQKLRACAYKVISDYEKVLDDTSTRTVEEVEDYYYEDEDDDYECLDLSDLEEGMSLVFLYKGDIRYCIVHSVDDDGFLGVLEPKDQSFDKYETQYRKFLWDNCEEVEQT